MKKTEKREPNLFGVLHHPIMPDNIDEVLNEEVKTFGSNGGHITIKGKHVGKKARVIIYKKEEEDKK